VQFRHVLIVEGVVRLKTNDLGWARAGLTIRYATHKGGGRGKKQTNLGTETHLREKEKIEGKRNIYRDYKGVTAQKGRATDRDCILERALGIYKIPLDERIRRLELTKFGVVGVAKQILRDRRQGLRV